MKQAAYNSYQQNFLNVESPLKLVEMLYEGVLKFTALSKRAIENDDIEKKVYYINRTIDIFTELLASLNYDKGGDVANYLCGLYTHQVKLLSQANVDHDTSKIDIVINVTKGLLEAWREVNQHELGK